MTLNNVLQKLYAEEMISVNDYNNDSDEVGEHQFFFGHVGELYADEAKLRQIGGREVEVITQGLVSLMIAI